MTTVPDGDENEAAQKKSATTKNRHHFQNHLKSRQSSVFQAAVTLSTYLPSFETQLAVHPRGGGLLYKKQRLVLMLCTTLFTPPGHQLLKGGKENTSTHTHTTSINIHQNHLYFSILFIHFLRSQSDLPRSCPRWAGVNPPGRLAHTTPTYANSSLNPTHTHTHTFTNNDRKNPTSRQRPKDAISIL